MDAKRIVILAIRSYPLPTSESATHVIITFCRSTQKKGIRQESCRRVQESQVGPLRNKIRLTIPTNIKNKSYKSASNSGWENRFLAIWGVNGANMLASYCLKWVCYTSGLLHHLLLRACPFCEAFNGPVK